MNDISVIFGMFTLLNYDRQESPGEEMWTAINMCVCVWKGGDGKVGKYLSV